jgi:hypothetical protein
LGLHEFEMEEFLHRFFENMIDRVSGPMHFRIIMQPVMASVFGVLSGLRDARLGKPPYLMTLLSVSEDKIAILKDGWSSVGRIFLLAVVLDIVYQLIEQNWIYPGEVLITAILLAIVPYIIIRGIVNRVATKLSKEREIKPYDGS